jgi:transcriptional repressor NrdR
LKCPYCDCLDTRVLDSRDTSEPAVRRRRQCVACGKRFTTYERVDSPLLQVVKRDGRVEDFDRDKLEMGILKACEKRPISRDVIAQMIDDIEETLRSDESTEIPSMRIGELLMDRLKGVDQVAYLRFASVYKEFTDAAHFEQEVKTLLSEGGTVDDTTSHGTKEAKARGSAADKTEYKTKKAIALNKAKEEMGLDTMDRKTGGNN